MNRGPQRLGRPGRRTSTHREDRLKSEGRCGRCAKWMPRERYSERYCEPCHTQKLVRQRARYREQRNATYIGPRQKPPLEAAQDAPGATNGHATIYADGRAFERLWPAPGALGGVKGGSLLCPTEGDERYRRTGNVLADSVPDTNGLQ